MGELSGKRVLVLRAREQAGKLAELLRARGAEPVMVPVLEIHPPSDPRPMMDAVCTLADRSGWVVFTSANGVEHVLAEIARQGKDARVLGNVRVAAVGPATASALAAAGIVPDLVAREHHGEGLAADLLEAMDGSSSKPPVLIFRAEVARDVLPDTLRKFGCDVEIVAVYKTTAPPRATVDGLAARLRAGEIDAVVFTSPSSVNHLCDGLGVGAAPLLSRAIVVSIGPVTTQAADARGVKVDVTASLSTMAGLLTSLEEHLSLRGR
ncbi:MAG: uroporphyrinogen-III synthase [Polyangiaceae bacterium]|nr:uroporphyrinogen-III synthase [Polyangiaceae bacterium]